MVVRRRSISAAALLFVLTACTTAPAASPSSPPPVASPTSTPTETASVTAVPSPASPSPSAGPSVASHTMTCTYGDASACEITGIDQDGDAVAGWPISLTGECHDPVTGPDGRAHVVCNTEGDAGNDRDGVVHTLLADGTAAPGWPVALPDSGARVSSNDFGVACGTDLPGLAVATDGTVFVGSAGTGGAELHAFRADGTVLPGWPQAFPGDPSIDDWGEGCRGFTLAPDGSIVAWGYEDVIPDILLTARRTVFTVLEPDGSTRPGWPRGSEGAASGPIVGDDGSLSYVTAAGNVWRHGTDGEPLAGWPYALGETLRPYRVADGRLAFVREGAEPEAIMIDASGDLVAGWPVALDRSPQSRCLFGDTPCGGITDPIFAPDGRMFVALGTPPWDETADDGAIAVIGPNGRTVADWPVLIGEQTAYAVGLSFDAGGRLIVHAVRCASPIGSCPPAWEYATLVYETGGTLVETRPGSQVEPDVLTPE